MTEVERLKCMLEEALRCLRRHTGMSNWDAAVASRVDAGVQSKTCPECSGLGHVYRVSIWGDDEYHDCEECNRLGYVLVPLDRIELVSPP